MKIEKLSKGKFIKTSIIVLVVVSIFGVIFINKSKAKYRVTQSIQVVSGEVNYKVPDFSLISINLQEEEGSSNYTSSGSVPTTGYSLNETKTYCTIGGTEYKGKSAYNGQGISINYNGSNVDFLGFNKANTKCYLYLDVQETLVNKLKDKVNSTSEGCPNYEETPSVTSVETSKSLLCKGIDDFGDMYYYRGAVTNNWVKLGNFYWRIIRFNGNGSIRLIYSGNGSPATSGTDTQIKKLAYNTQSNNAQYVKYMYGSTNSTIKADLDSWYQTNLKSTYGSKMDGTVGFCNDTDAGSPSGYFKTYNRISTDKKPTFKCGTPKTNLFTTSDGTYGNQKLTNPIGLITVDEAGFAGGLKDLNNTGYYLYTGQGYWTMSPFYFTGSAAVFPVYFNGSFDNIDYYVNSSLGVRPVINLKSDTTFKEGGTGTSTNPYEVII